MSTPAALAGGAEVVEAEWQKLSTRKIATREQAAVIAWPYTSFGTQGAPGPAKAIEPLAATMVSFPNGTRLIVKPTKFKPGEIQIGVRFGQGSRGLDPNNTVPGFLWTIGGLQEAGLGKLDAQQLQTALAGKLVGMSAQHWFRPYRRQLRLILPRRGVVHAKHCWCVRSCRWRSPTF
jgi:zinc protease